jgi:hypothetical protein
MAQWRTDSKGLLHHRRIYKSTIALQRARPSNTGNKPDAPPLQREHPRRGRGAETGADD